MQTRSFVLDGDPKRFWDISWDGPDVEVTYGKWGTDGRCHERSFETPAARDAYIEGQIAKIRRKGYRESDRVAATADGRTPKVEAEARALEAWLTGQRREAWDPVLEQTSAPGVARFRGAMTLDAGEAWPTCGSCGRPLAGLFELDRAGLPDPTLRADDCVQLFACESWSNDEPGSADCIVGAWLARRHARGTPRHETPPGASAGAHPPTSVVSWTERSELPPIDVVGARLDECSEETLDALVRMAGGALSDDPFDAYRAFAEGRGERSANRHKLGGWPTFVQEPVRPWARQLFQLERGAPLHANFGDVGAAHLLLTSSGTLDFFWASH